MKAFLNYYKWHIFFFALFIVCTLVFTISSCRKNEPDLVINVISTGRINVQAFDDRKAPLLKLLSHDADGDGEKTMQLYSYPFDRQTDMNEAFEILATPADSDIVITTKETLISFENKDLFVDMKEFVSGIDTDKYTTLKDDSGKIYAASLEGNDYIKDMGFYDTTGLYIAVISDEDGDEISKEKKNARNITLAIIKEYNF